MVGQQSSTKPTQASFKAHSANPPNRVSLLVGVMVMDGFVDDVRDGELVIGGVSVDTVGATMTGLFVATIGATDGAEVTGLFVSTMGAADGAAPPPCKSCWTSSSDVSAKLTMVKMISSSATMASVSKETYTGYPKSAFESKVIVDAAVTSCVCK